MAVPIRHVFSQGPMLATMGRAAMSHVESSFASALSLRSSVRTRPPAVGGGKAGDAPGPWIEARVGSPSAALVRDYVRHVGGDPAIYRGIVPAHLFPLWGLPLAARALAPLGYPLARVINAGCRLELRAPLALGGLLDVRARVEAIEQDERRAVVTQRVVTGTSRAPDAVVADLRVFIPLAKPNGQRHNGASVPRVRTVPASGVHELAYLRIGAGAGLDFAKLTGDFNPIHWLKPFARAAGYGGCILHGFSTLARAVEALHRALFSGSVGRLAAVDARFTAPVVLPATVGVYVGREGGSRGGLWVGDAPQGRAYLEGHFEEGGVA